VVLQEAKKGEEGNNSVSTPDKTAAVVARFLLRKQERFAEGMDKMFRDMNIKKLKLFLFFFCASAGGYSAFLILAAITGPQKRGSEFKTDQIYVPKHFDKTGDGWLPRNYADEETFFRPQALKKYMDSLKHNRRNQYDSILQQRPHLMDSVLALEEIFYSQKQK
jgi:hypothetical protein